MAYYTATVTPKNPHTMRPTLIALATAWGPRFGGINTFNTELLKSLGIYQGRGFEVACVLPRVSAEEAKDAERAGGTLRD